MSGLQSTQDRTTGLSYGTPFLTLVNCHPAPRRLSLSSTCNQQHARLRVQGLASALPQAHAPVLLVSMALRASLVQLVSSVRHVSSALVVVHLVTMEFRAVDGV